LRVRKTDVGSSVDGHRRRGSMDSTANGMRTMRLTALRRAPACRKARYVVSWSVHRSSARSGIGVSDPVAFQEHPATVPSPSDGNLSRDIEVQPGTLYEGIFAFSATQPDVEAACSRFGDIRDMRLTSGHDTGRLQGPARVRARRTAEPVRDESRAPRWTKSDRQHRRETFGGGCGGRRDRLRTRSVLSRAAAGQT